MAGTLWLATDSGSYSLDPATGRIRQYSHDPNDPSSLSSNNVKSSGDDKEGRLCVANSEGLDEFDRQTGKVTLHVPVHELRARCHSMKIASAFSGSSTPPAMG
jgi:ligand-binding sensor domain-containing protein